LKVITMLELFMTPLYVLISHLKINTFDLLFPPLKSRIITKKQ